jgi:pimeloyl-ACP methyl ester carboxylesterase
MAWPTALRRLHVERHGDDQWLGIMTELCERAAVRPMADLATLAAIACPILVVIGTHDDPRRVRQAHQLRETNDRCELVPLDGAGHAVHRERPTEVAEAIGDFLATHGGSARP